MSHERGRQEDLKCYDAETKEIAILDPWSERLVLRCPSLDFCHLRALPILAHLEDLRANSTIGTTTQEATLKLFSPIELLESSRETEISIEGDPAQEGEGRGEGTIETRAGLSDIDG
jgi:hypothetical protein